MSQGSLQCKPKCGNGIVVGDEECEIGGDGCSGTCTCLPGWYPRGDKSVSCYRICGDGTVAGDEECDRGSGCSDDCKCLSGWHSNGNPSCYSTCGDNYVVGDEECEWNGNGCDNYCKCLDGWRSRLDGSRSCIENCGDGMVVGEEECDSSPFCSDKYCICMQDHPYNNESGGCSYCGNGYVEGKEECDKNDMHCDNSTCKCSTGYSLENVSGMMICSKSKNNKNNNNMIIFICVVIGIIIIIVIVIVVMILKKNGANGDYIEMDEDLYEVEMTKRKKGKLEIKQTLYESPTTIVYKGIMNNEIDVVVKIMKMWGTKLDSSQSREMELMRKLHSDYIVEYYGTSVIEGRLGIVMEFMPLGSLEGLMSKKVLSSELKIRYVREICYGMRYLHSMNIIHRDLKLTNVLVVSDDSNSTQAICKISDFGTSRKNPSFE